MVFAPSWNTNVSHEHGFVFVGAARSRCPNTDIDVQRYSRCSIKTFSRGDPVEKVGKNDQPDRRSKLRHPRKRKCYPSGWPNSPFVEGEAQRSYPSEPSCGPATNTYDMRTFDKTERATPLRPKFTSHIPPGNTVAKGDYSRKASETIDFEANRANKGCANSTASRIWQKCRQKG